MERPYYQQYTNVKDYLDYILSITNNNVKGKLFEQFLLDFFHVHRDYGFNVKNVIPGNKASTEIKAACGLTQSTAIEVGCDLFIEYNDGSYGIVQAKCYNEESLQLQHLSGFFAAQAASLSASLRDSKIHCKHFFIATTCKTISRNFYANNGVNYILYNDLCQHNNLLNDINIYHQTKVKPNYKTINFYSHQVQCIENVVGHLLVARRCLINMMCGTGKSLTNIGIAFAMPLCDINITNIIIFVPSIELAEQNGLSWRRSFTYQNKKIEHLIISSNPQTSMITTTTNTDKINQFMSTAADLRVVTCVYNSSALVQNYNFDLAFYDEAHHTVGKMDNNNYYNCVEFNNIKYKVFETATLKVCKNVNYRSMDNINTYGPVVYKYTLDQAICQNKLNSYRICFYSYQGDKLDMVQYNDKNYPPAYITCAHAIKDAILSGRRKILIYHNLVKSAELMEKLLCEFFIKDSSIYIASAFGQTRAIDRKAILDNFKSNDISILCSVAILAEGIDIPDVDTVCFADPRHSELNITQCIGRCLRLSLGKLESLVLVPYNINDADPFTMIKDVLYALGQQDGAIMEELLTKPMSPRFLHNYKFNNTNIVNDYNCITYQNFLKSLRATILLRNFQLTNEMTEKVNDKEFDIFVKSCSQIGSVPVNRWPKSHGHNQEFVNLSNYDGINYELMQLNLIKRFNQLTDIQREQLWSIPNWKWDNGIDELEWTFMYDKVLVYYNVFGHSPNDNDADNRLYLWLQEQKSRFTGRNCLSELCKQKLLTLPEFIAPKITKAPLSGFAKVAYNVVVKYLTESGNTEFLPAQMAGLVNQMYSEAGSRAVSKTSSFSRDLGQLVDKGYLLYNRVTKYYSLP